jgi:transcriptional regulator with XRE-family HTH domain
MEQHSESMLLAGRLRDSRRARGWSLEELAAASGVSRSMLSEIERGTANPTLGLAHAIARALDMTIGELVDGTATSSAMHVVRADDREYHYRTGPDCSVRTLSPLLAGRHVELYEVRLGAGAELRSTAHFSGTRELVTVGRGRVRVESGDDEEVLDQGDSIEYRADVDHAIVNAGRGQAIVYLVDVYR